MNNKKQRLIFDATVIANMLSKDERRSGISWTAFNLLRELVRQDKFQISLYCTPKMVNKLLELKSQGEPVNNFL